MTVLRQCGKPVWAPALSGLCLLFAFASSSPAAVIAGFVGEAPDTWPGVPGVRIQTSDGGFTYTDRNGEFVLILPEYWSGSLTPSLSNVVFSPPRRYYRNLVNGEWWQTFAAQTPRRIMGSIPGCAEVTIRAFPGNISTVTDAEGQFTLHVPYGWSGTIRPLCPGYTFTPSFLKYDTLVNHLYALSFMPEQAFPSLSGTVRLRGVPLADFPVWVGSNGAVRTGSDGSYWLSVPRGWSGTLTPDPAYGFTPASRTLPPVDRDREGLDFVGDYVVISGCLRDERGRLVKGEVGGTRVESVKTPRPGFYQLRVPPGWSGAIRPIGLGNGTGAVASRPESLSFHKLAHDIGNQDFVILSPDIEAKSAYFKQWTDDRMRVLLQWYSYEVAGMYGWMNCLDGQDWTLVWNIDGKQFGALTVNNYTPAFKTTASREAILPEVLYLATTPGMHTLRLRAIRTGDANTRNNVVTVPFRVVDGPFLEVSPEKLAFTALPLGAREERVFTIRNAGLGLVRGQASVSFPFQIVSGRNYSLKTGENHTLVVRFEPDEPGAFACRLSFTGADADAAKVTGTAYTGQGTGLEGAYFASPEAGEPVTRRLDAGLDFDWAAGPPVDGLASNGYWIAWSGALEPRYSGLHTLCLNSGGPAELWVDGARVASNTAAAWAESGGQVTLEAGRRHPIEVVYAQAGPEKGVQLLWSHPRMEREVVPASQLYPR